MPNSKSSQSPTEKNLMAGLVFADTSSNEQESMMQAAACLAHFAAAPACRIHELKRQIRVLEQSGSLAEALAITEELYAWNGNRQANGLV
jgi:hypothetical protein